MEIKEGHWLNVNHPELLNHIIECQKKAKNWDELTESIIMDDDFSDTLMRNALLRSENERLKLRIKELEYNGV